MSPCMEDTVKLFCRILSVSQSTCTGREKERATMRVEQINRSAAS
jgi:hypothetical protein